MVSIIVPVFNSEMYLEECIKSVLEQSFKKWELIFVDDCSTDRSRSIIESFALQDNRIKMIFLCKNVGAGIARNKGIELAKGRYIAFLDSDDYWHKEKLKKQLDFMINQNIEFSYTRYYELDSKDRPSNIILSPTLVTSKKLLFNNYIKTLTAIYDTARIGKIYMPDYRKRQDWGLWFNILKKTKSAHGLSEPLAYYRTSNDSLSNSKLKLLKENFNFYRFYLNNSIFKSLIMMILFLCVHIPFKWFGKRVL